MNPNEWNAREITRYSIRKIVESGRECHVDGVTDSGVWTTNVSALVEDVFAVGEAVLLTRFIDTGERSGWVLFIPSNGEDVLSDYAMGLSEVIEPVLDWIEVS